MYPIHKSPTQTEQKTGVILIFKPKVVKEQPQPCIFCGDTFHLQIFKGQTVCSSCLQDIPSLFICS